ncbi:MAG: PrsW family glutamic-type intramembrane protease [Candidatus Paceibacterota bacterium]
MIHYFLFLFFGLLPSLIWLVFYLKEDDNPEPKELILKIFVYGMAVTVLVGILECVIGTLIICPNPMSFIKNPSLFFPFPKCSPSTLLQYFLYFFVAIAFMEEAAKYLVVRIGAYRSKHFDEPIDAMIYMVVAGLGFAAVENILILFPTSSPVAFQDTVWISIARFLSATLLHALTAANIGFFASLAFFKKKKKFRYVPIGLFIATVFHGIYNFGINREIFTQQIMIPTAVLVFLFILVSIQFSIARNLKQKYEIQN